MLLEKSSRSQFVHFFSNPLVGMLGSIASIVGVGLAVLFYVESKEVRHLIYYAHPAKATLVHSGLASGLEVTFNKKPITTDVTAVQVAIWNDGELPIKKDNVLESVTLSTKPPVPILEASIRTISRRLIKLQLDQAQREEGRVRILWQILEHNDGGVIQLIHEGGSDIDIVAEGSIEGQSEIDKLKFSGKIISAKEQYEDFRKDWILLVRATGAMGLLTIFVFGALLYRRKLEGYKIISEMLYAMIFCVLSFFLICLYSYIQLPPEGPPFEFSAQQHNESLQPTAYPPRS